MGSEEVLELPAPLELAEPLGALLLPSCLVPAALPEPAEPPELPVLAEPPVSVVGAGVDGGVGAGVDGAVGAGVGGAGVGDACLIAPGLIAGRQVPRSSQLGMGAICFGVGDARPQLPLPVGCCGVGVGDVMPQLPPPVGGGGSSALASETAPAVAAKTAAATKTMRLVTLIVVFILLSFLFAVTVFTLV